MLGDPFYWNALGNMVWYALAIVVELGIAFGLALLLNTQNPRPQVLPRGVPAAVDAVAGRGVLDDRQVDARVPVRARVAVHAHAGLGRSAFFASPEIAEDHDDGPGRANPSSHS